MTVHPSFSQGQTEADETPDRAACVALARQAGDYIAPLWPLKSFVAVNPYLGLSGGDFEAGAANLAFTAGAQSTLPRSLARAALARGDVSDSDITDAIRALGSDLTVYDVKASLAAERPDAKPMATRTSAAQAESGLPFDDLSINRISQFCSHYFDQGQSYYTPLPSAEIGIWDAFLTYAGSDRSFSAQGLGTLHKTMRKLPKDAGDALAVMLGDLGVPAASASLYLQRLLRSVGGWAAYARQQSWLADADTTPSVLRPVDLLAAIRLSYDWAVDRMAGDFGRAEFDSALRLAQTAPALVDPTDLILQEAYERAVQRQLIAEFGRSQASIHKPRPALQAAFCIDVRSEVLRRAVESTIPSCETIGFAGFFGLPVEYRSIGMEEGRAQCPVLLKPTHVIEEQVCCSSEEDHAVKREASRRHLRSRIFRAFKRFGASAVSSFAFVETLGVFFAGKLIASTLNLSRPAPRAADFGLSKKAAPRPHVHTGHHSGTLTGIPLQEQIDQAVGILSGMALTRDFAPIVLLIGHGSTSVNNPHAAGLDCGACGGHAGDVNARLVADILNSSDVRQGLAQAGIAIPSETVFIAGLHDTTTDDITLFEDCVDLTASLASQLNTVKEQLAEASDRARRERGALFQCDERSKKKPGHADFFSARGRDWSQVRPEWGLAGCSHFIVAPRHRTQSHDLSGRAFLHSYDWRADGDSKILELIMTAPMIVASWISLQYFASTVDNRAFGSGNKTLHNVVGQVGVLEGNTGDLRTGLPLQSISDGETLIHKPHRLNVVIEAPREAILGVIQSHQIVRDLLDNRWIHLFLMDNEGRITAKYEQGGRWAACAGRALPGGRSKTAA